MLQILREVIEMRINGKYITLLFGMIMGSLTSFIISAVLTLANNGLQDFLQHWLRNWMIAICLAVPIATFFPPVIRRELAKITELGKI